MTVKELRRMLELAPDDNEVLICVREPSGWCCPDGATVGLNYVVQQGTDFHNGHTLIVPVHALDIYDVHAWAHYTD